MKTRALASLIAKKEGKKSQAKIGDIREIVSILGQIFCSMPQSELNQTILELKKVGKKALARAK